QHRARARAPRLRAARERGAPGRPTRRPPRRRAARGRRARASSRTVKQRGRIYRVPAMELRDLPSVDELARESDDPLAVDAARAVIDCAREEIQAGADPGDLAARVREELADARRPRLQRVLNATGVVVHTNL